MRCGKEPGFQSILKRFGGVWMLHAHVFAKLEQVIPLWFGVLSFRTET